jgi:hypothetical protein
MIVTKKSKVTHELDLSFRKSIKEK